MLSTIAGTIVGPSQLARPQAKLMAEHLASGHCPFVRLVECRQSAQAEAIVVEVEVEMDQETAHDIRPIEPIALVFAGEDEMPAALALRRDFPLVPHLILGAPEGPRMLCLYDTPWSEARLTWTPPAFIERIRLWLARTARGELHAADQPLEPLLLPTGYILVLPSDCFSDDQDEATFSRLSVVMAGSAEPRVLIAERQTEGQPQRAGLDFVLTGFRCPVQQHGVVRHAPRDLSELHELLLGTGLDLIDGLRRRLAAWAAEASAMAAHLLIAVAMPKLREHSVEVEAEDVWVFLTEATAANVGVAIGCVERVPGSKMVARKILFDQERIGKGVRIDPVTPVLAFNRRAAARSTGLEESDDRHVVCVGVGALESQVVTNMVREGFGVWTLVNSDHLLPHNLARHAAPGNAVGHGKAEVMAALLEELFASGPRPNPIQANVLDRHAAKEELMAAFAAADLIVYMSASVAVARHLARERDASARRMSLFLNPAGTDLVLLAEDAARSIPLDALEMQYYQAVASRPELLGHLAPPDGRVRYGRSCRDVSSTIPQSRVGLLAGIASAALRRAADDPAPAIAVWRIREPDLGVDVIRCESHPVLIEHHGGWVVSLDQHLLDRLWHHRLERSPDGTGGVLVGSFDAQRQIVHVVETILSPADSKEWPTLYIRGAEGLAERLQQISGHTLGQLRYVGEWHSHPDGYGCEPSRDDRQVLAWLGEHMAAEGLPAVMAIVGRDKHRFLVRSIEKIDVAA